MKVEKISVALTQELAASVREAVESGDYATSSEVIREALRAWNDKRSAAARDVETLRALIAEGHASGSAPLESTEALLAEFRARAAKAQ